jgi:hemoglobin
MAVDSLEASTSIFDKIGGMDTVHRLVETFYKNMDTLPGARDIRAMHAQNLAPTQAILKLYLAEWLGGPAEYSATRGHPRLRMRHVRFSIGPAERDAWMLCMDKALDETIEDAVIRESLREKFAKLADWVRNDPDNEHDKRH